MYNYRRVHLLQSIRTNLPKAYWLSFISAAGKNISDRDGKNCCVPACTNYFEKTKFYIDRKVSYTTICRTETRTLPMALSGLLCLAAS